LELWSETVTTPELAAEVSATVPVPDCPAVMMLGLTETLLRVPTPGGMIINAAVLKTPE
jgi:hypothetical protein